MKKYAGFRGGEVWWEIITPPNRAKKIYDRVLVQGGPGLSIGAVTNIRVSDDDCIHADELPDYVLVEIARRALI